jgi:hypothetical protein
LLNLSPISSKDGPSAVKEVKGFRPLSYSSELLPLSDIELLPLSDDGAIGVGTDESVDAALESGNGGGPFEDAKFKLSMERVIDDEFPKGRKIQS